MPVQLSVTTDDNIKHRSLPLEAALTDPTPPVTPPIEDHVPSENSSQSQLGRQSRSPFLCPVASKTRRHVAVSDTPLEFTDDLNFRCDPSGQRVEFGRGAWSIVYKATSRQPAGPPMLTPPSSPASGGRVLAVKSPLRRDAHSILRAEALALSRINRQPGSDNHVVPFHGYITSSNSIVMFAIPLALSTHIENKATVAKNQLSTRTMFDPVLGKASWQDLATKLITGLSWLHNEAQIVHGDIKPHNILLRPTSTAEQDTFPYDPLFADFSSAHDLSLSPAAEGTTMSAMTPPFTAPELLLLPSLRSSDATPSLPSDIFSLAVTLLTAATGDLLLYPGSNHMQRLAMARDGHRVLDFVRSGPNACRVPKNGTVEQVVKPAIMKDPNQRVVAGEWLRVVGAVA